MYVPADCVATVRMNDCEKQLENNKTVCIFRKTNRQTNIIYELM